MIHIYAWLKGTLDNRLSRSHHRSSWLWRNIILKINAYFCTLHGKVSEVYKISTAVCWHPPFTRFSSIQIFLPLRASNLRTEPNSQTHSSYFHDRIIWSTSSSILFSSFFNGFNFHPADTLPTYFIKLF